MWDLEELILISIFYNSFGKMTDVIGFTKVKGISSLCLDMYSASWKATTMVAIFVRKEVFQEQKIGNIQLQMTMRETVSFLGLT